MTDSNYDERRSLRSELEQALEEADTGALRITLARLPEVAPTTRKQCLQSLKTVAEDAPDTLAAVISIAATKNAVGYLADVDRVGIIDRRKTFVDTDNRGRTGVDGLYAAGWMTAETVHQAIVSAGHGAHAAISSRMSDIAARYWPAVADHYVDWVVHVGRYAGDEEWADHTREWFEEEILVDGVETTLAESALEHLRTEFIDRQIDADEWQRRDREGQLALLEQMDDDLVNEYAASLQHTDT
ncbi:hypothetical protein [Halobellus sp. EA9]|uniref:hypothetical protein n=1 Tax=Halobellus sp. EA9 TaxID=3421647 RepID=UPI003EB6C54A